jgi:hypothetical protein
MRIFVAGLFLLLFFDYGTVLSQRRFIYAADSSPVDINHLTIGKEYILDFQLVFDDTAWTFSRNLDSLSSLLHSHPCWSVEIGNHTDCRASRKHNDSLSQSRAEMLRDSVIAHGATKRMISAKGYGERHLLNNCGCEPNDTGPGKDCTEAEHQLNRRYTLKLLGMSSNCPYK